MRGEQFRMNASNTEQAGLVGFVRTHALKAALEAVFNFTLPFLIYSYGSGRYGNVDALMAASAPPVLWSITTFIRERRIDAISVLVLAGIALSLLAFVGGGGVRFLQLRENLVAGVAGLVFLGSAVIGKPLIYQLARAGARRRGAGRLATIEALRGESGFHKDLSAVTLVWGFVLLAACALNCTLVFLMSIRQFMLISSSISYGVVGLLTALTFWLVPRAVRRAEARRTAR